MGSVIEPLTITVSPQKNIEEIVFFGFKYHRTGDFLFVEISWFSKVHFSLEYEKVVVVMGLIFGEKQKHRDCFFLKGLFFLEIENKDISWFYGALIFWGLMVESALSETMTCICLLYTKTCFKSKGGVNPSTKP